MILLLIQGIQAAIAAAPQTLAILAEAKNFITALFTHGVISKDTQNAMHTHVDAYCAALLAGTMPPAWVVEADPV